MVESDEEAGELPVAVSEEAADAAAAPAEVTAPWGYDDIDAGRLEQERLDPSWQRYAGQDREERGAYLAGKAIPPAAAEPAAEDEAAARTGNATLARLRDEAPAAAEPSAGGGASGPDAGAARPPAAADSGDDETAAAATAPAAPESWEDISPETLRGGVPRFPIATDGGGPTVFRVQWLLDRVRFSPGVIDGRWGKNTAKAVYWLQASLGLEPTGTLDPDLYRRLAATVEEASPVRRYTVTAEDLAGPFTEVPEEPEAQAELECLCHATPAEAIAERFHTTEELLARLNPDADLVELRPGVALWVPAVEVVRPGEAGEPGASSAVARIVISKRGFYLHAVDASGRLIYHFPSTLGNRYDPSPRGRYEVEGVAWNPDFHYQPKLFSEVPDTDEDFLLPPGPNSPVGLVWLQLSKENYGIHGTARPETIGYTTSHGCIRLTNWDAVFLGQRVKPGTPVEFRS